MGNKLTRFFSTFAYLGDFPVASGTVASVVGFLLYIILLDQPVVYGLVFLVVTAVGFYVSGKTERMVKQKDPSCVVIDEVSGSMIAAYLLPLEPKTLITAFFLFRAFDMFKIYPAKQCEMMGGSMGIMMDDLVAGFYTFLTMQVAILLTAIV